MNSSGCTWEMTRKMVSSCRVRRPLQSSIAIDKPAASAPTLTLERKQSQHSSLLQDEAIIGIN